MTIKEELIDEIEGLLEKLVAPEIARIVEAVTAEPGSPGSLVVKLPSAKDVDLSTSELSYQVRHTANIYGEAARLQGMARAELKVLEGQFKRKFKANLSGSSKEEREKNAMNVASHEYRAMQSMAAIVELADSLEAIARVASESARKIYGAQGNTVTAHKREAFSFEEDDFSSF